MKLEPMVRRDEGQVRNLFATCHPGWPARPARWFQAYPTLVAVEDGQLVGFTSFSVTSYSGVPVLGGQDLCVLPAAQGTGVGLALHLERCAIGESVGARMFSGLTSPDNKPMVRIFERCGYHACQPVPRAFPDGDGVIYLGAL